MTLALLLMRHGKSDWGADYGTDIDRPLNPRGHKAAKLMGRFLDAADQQPDYAISSPARRARETLDLASRAGKWTCPTTTSAAFYECGPSETFQLLRSSVPPDARTVLIVGHEPTWSEVVEILTGADIRLPTAAVARVNLAVHRWDALAARTGQLSWLVPPRLLAATRRV